MALADTSLINQATKLNQVNMLINPDMCPCGVKITKSQMKLKSYQQRTILAYTDPKGKTIYLSQCKKPKFDGSDKCYKHHDSYTKNKCVYILPDIIDKCTLFEGAKDNIKDIKNKKDKNIASKSKLSSTVSTKKMDKNKLHLIKLLCYNN